MRKLNLIGLGAVVAALGLAATAQAGVVTYTSTDVPKAFDDGQTVTSSLTVPPGRPPATDVEVAPLQAFTPIGSGDRAIFLRGPNNLTSLLIPSGCNSFNVNATFDDSAANPWDTNGSCSAPAGTVLKPTTPLSALLSPSEGTWTMTASDPGNLLQAGPGSISGWSLRVTHAEATAPGGLELDVSAAKQRLKKGKVKLTVSCNVNCTITSGKDAKARSLSLSAGQSERVKLPLRRKARKRLDDGGKAKLALTATDETGGTDTDKLKVKIRG
jgi:hypothetical protein